MHRVRLLWTGNHRAWENVYTLLDTPFPSLCENKLIDQGWWRSNLLKATREHRIVILVYWTAWSYTALESLSPWVLSAWVVEDAKRVREWWYSVVWCVVGQDVSFGMQNMEGIIIDITSTKYNTTVKLPDTRKLFSLFSWPHSLQPADTQLLTAVKPIIIRKCFIHDNNPNWFNSTSLHYRTCHAFYNQHKVIINLFASTAIHPSIVLRLRDTEFSVRFPRIRCTYTCYTSFTLKVNMFLDDRPYCADGLLSIKIHYSRWTIKPPNSLLYSFPLGKRINPSIQPNLRNLALTVLIV